MFDFIVSEKPEYNVTHAYVDSVEERLHIKFPEVLRTFYTEHNVSDIEERPFTVHNLSFCVEYIMPLTNANISVEAILKVNENDQWIPKTFIPLAEDVDADYYYWDSQSGKVFYLTMGNVENPIPICESVQAFFEILNTSC